MFLFKNVIVKIVLLSGAFIIDKVFSQCLICNDELPDPDRIAAQGVVTCQQLENAANLATCEVFQRQYSGLCCEIFYDGNTIAPTPRSVYPQCDLCTDGKTPTNTDRRFVLQNYVAVPNGEYSCQQINEFGSDGLIHPGECSYLLSLTRQSNLCQCESTGAPTTMMPTLAATTELPTTAFPTRNPSKAIPRERPSMAPVVTIPVPTNPPTPVPTGMPLSSPTRIETSPTTTNSPTRKTRNPTKSPTISPIVGTTPSLITALPTRHPNKAAIEEKIEPTTLPPTRNPSKILSNEDTPAPVKPLTVSPTKKPTSLPPTSIFAPTAFPTPQPTACVDVPGWVDSVGDGCDRYTAWHECGVYGSKYKNNGLTDTDACCFCGGGQAVASLVTSPAPSPVPSPAPSPAPSPFPSPLPSPAPSSLDKLMADSISSEWLVAHNVRRNKYHNMYNVSFVPVSWSSRLESDATAWAEKLVNESVAGDWSTCTLTPDRNSYGNEILHSSSVPPSSIDAILEEWVEEKEYLDYPSNFEFTQVIWRATKWIGCASASKGSCHIQVCRYVTGGNCNTNANNIYEKMLEETSPCYPQTI